MPGKLLLVVCFHGGTIRLCKICACCHRCRPPREKGNLNRTGCVSSRLTNVSQRSFEPDLAHVRTERQIMRVERRSRVSDTGLPSFFQGLKRMRDSLAREIPITVPNCGASRYQPMGAPGGYSMTIPSTSWAGVSPAKVAARSRNGRMKSGNLIVGEAWRVLKSYSSPNSSTRRRAV